MLNVKIINKKRIKCEIRLKLKRSFKQEEACFKYKVLQFTTFKKKILKSIVSLLYSETLFNISDDCYCDALLWAIWCH